jgi:hypothetical protein
MLYPRYVSLRGICLRLRDTAYYRDAGDWWIGACTHAQELVNGHYRMELIADSRHYPCVEHLHGATLTEVDELTWYADNHRYVDESVLQDPLTPVRYRVNLFSLVHAEDHRPMTRMAQMRLRVEHFSLCGGW